MYLSHIILHKYIYIEIYFIHFIRNEIKTECNLSAFYIGIQFLFIVTIVTKLSGLEVWRNLIFKN